MGPFRLPKCLNQNLSPLMSSCSCKTMDSRKRNIFHVGREPEMFRLSLEKDVLETHDKDLENEGPPQPHSEGSSWTDSKPALVCLWTECPAGCTRTNTAPSSDELDTTEKVQWHMGNSETDSILTRCGNDETKIYRCKSKHSISFSVPF